MKKFHVRVLVLAIILFIGAIITSYAFDNKEAKTEDVEQIAENSFYALTVKVIDVDYENDVVTCEDFNGNLWSFYGCEDWCEDDCAGLLMDSKGTDLIYDDEIISAKYCGWILERWD